MCFEFWSSARDVGNFQLRWHSRSEARFPLRAEEVSGSLDAVTLPCNSLGKEGLLSRAEHMKEETSTTSIIRVLSGEELEHRRFFSGQLSGVIGILEVLNAADIYHKCQVKRQIPNSIKHLSIAKLKRQSQVPSYIIAKVRRL